MGGIRVDAESQEQPFLAVACGEAHRTSRSKPSWWKLLSDLITFGKRAGEFAAKRATDLAQPSIDDAQVNKAIEDMLAPLAREGGENPGMIYDEMREMMQHKVGIIRTKHELEEALGDLTAFKERAMASFPGTSRRYNSGWHQALDLINMADVSRACTCSAHSRRKPWRPYS